MNELLKGDAVIVSEVGQNQMWTAQYFCFRQPRTWITSGGLGTMGYGFPAAIGAHFARPDVPVFDVAGDGSIQMNIQEMGTVAQYKIPVKIAILNNMYLGMVRQWQELFYDRRYCVHRTAAGGIREDRAGLWYRRHQGGVLRRGHAGLKSRGGLRRAVCPGLPDRAGGERLSRWSRPVLRSTR